jgi:hypothetical protein
LDDGDASEWTRWSEQLERLRAYWQSERYKTFKARESERNDTMAIELNGADFQGGKGGTVPEGTYACKLMAAYIYKSNKFQSEEENVQLDLLWDTELSFEDDDGKEFDGIVRDSFITLSLNESSNLATRLKAIFGKSLEVKNAKVKLEIEGHENTRTLNHWRGGDKAKINIFDVNGESVFGKEATIGVGIKDNGYNKVTSVSAPMKQVGTRRAAPAGAPA